MFDPIRFLLPKDPPNVIQMWQSAWTHVTQQLSTWDKEKKEKDKTASNSSTSPTPIAKNSTSNSTTAAAQHINNEGTVEIDEKLASSSPNTTDADVSALLEATKIEMMEVFNETTATSELDPNRPYSPTVGDEDITSSQATNTAASTATTPFTSPSQLPNNRKSDAPVSTSTPTPNTIPNVLSPSSHPTAISPPPSASSSLVRPTNATSPPPVLQTSSQPHPMGRQLTQAELRKSNAAKLRAEKKEAEQRYMKQVKNRMYQKLFSLPNNEQLIEDYSCAIRKSILLHGRMYVSWNYVCFFSSIFSHKTVLTIPAGDILHVTAASVALLFDNSIKLYVQTGPLPIPNVMDSRGHTLLSTINGNALAGTNASSNQQLVIPTANNNGLNNNNNSNTSNTNSTVNNTTNNNNSTSTLLAPIPVTPATSSNNLVVSHAIIAAASPSPTGTHLSASAADTDSNSTASTKEPLSPKIMTTQLMTDSAVTTPTVAVSSTTTTTSSASSSSTTSQDATTDATSPHEGELHDAHQSSTSPLDTVVGSSSISPSPLPSTTTTSISDVLSEMQPLPSTDSSMLSSDDESLSSLLQPGKMTPNASVTLTSNQIQYLINTNHPNIQCYFFASYMMRDHCLSLIDGLVRKRREADPIWNLAQEHWNREIMKEKEREREREREIEKERERERIRRRDAQVERDKEREKEREAIASANSQNNSSTATDSSSLTTEGLRQRRFSSVDSDGASQVPGISSPSSPSLSSSNNGRADVSSSVESSPALGPREGDEQGLVTSNSGSFNGLLPPKLPPKQRKDSRIHTLHKATSSPKTTPMSASLSTASSAPTLSVDCLNAFKNLKPNLGLPVPPDDFTGISFDTIHESTLPVKSHTIFVACYANACAFPIQHYHAFRKDTEFACGKWYPSKTIPNALVRQLQYRMALDAPIGPSSTRVFKEQTAFFTENSVRIDTRNFTPDVPFGEGLHVLDRMTITDLNQNSCKLVANLAVRVTKPSWKMKPFLSTIRNKTKEDVTKWWEGWVAKAAQVLKNTELVQAAFGMMHETDGLTRILSPKQTEAAATIPSSSNTTAATTKTPSSTETTTDDLALSTSLIETISSPSVTEIPSSVAPALYSSQSVTLEKWEWLENGLKHSPFSPDTSQSILTVINDYRRTILTMNSAERFAIYVIFFVFLLQFVPFVPSSSVLLLHVPLFISLFTFLLSMHTRSVKLEQSLQITHHLLSQQINSNDKLRLAIDELTQQHKTPTLRIQQESHF